MAAAENQLQIRQKLKTLVTQSHQLSEKRKEGCEENQLESSQESKSKGKKNKDTLENENKPKLNIK